MKNQPITIAGVTIKPGERKEIELPAASLYTQTPMNIPIHVIHGVNKGPRVFITAAVHGDEINGVEIIRLLLNHHCLKKIRGTLILVPVANIYGFITLSRYLPDRRDLNRSFPGSKAGSLAARLAYLFMNEIISQCTHGIDLHTGRKHIENLPHIRINTSVFGAKRMARYFNVPVVVDAKLRDGSLRQAAAELDIPILVYEAGEALRFNDLSIRLGFHGVLNVLQGLRVINSKKYKTKPIKSKLARASTWLRAPESGIVHALKSLGDSVKEGELLGIIAAPFSKQETPIKAPCNGIIIGRNTLPLVNEGDALFNIAKLKNNKKVASQFDQLQEDLGDSPLILSLNEDE